MVRVLVVPFRVVVLVAAEVPLTPLVSPLPVGRVLLVSVV